MKILVCDDEDLARSRLIRFIEDIDGGEVAGEAANGEDAIRLVNERQPDVVLLDIRMPRMDGMEAARRITEMTCPPAIIFTTAYDDHALDAFDVKAAGYLMKPVRKEKLAEALNRAKQFNRVQREALEDELGDGSDRPKRRSHITAKTHRGIELIPVKEVRYFLADQKYVTVRHAGGEVLIDDTLKELETEFAPDFIRIHRNALLSLEFLEGLELINQGQYQVRIRGVPDKLVVSRRHLAELRRTMQGL